MANQPENEEMYFTCIGTNHGAPCQPATRELWEQKRSEPWLSDMCRRIEQGEEQLKHRLPVWTPHCAGFRNDHRAAADAVRPLARLMLDFDEKGHTDEILSRLMAHSPLKVLLVEESVRKGTHVLVSLPQGMTVDEAQSLMGEAAGFTPDKAVKDVSRCIYMVSSEHTRYLSDELFEPVAVEPVPSPVEVKAAEDEQKKHFPDVFKGIPYDAIINEYWNLTDGEPHDGERNQKLYQLAVNLRAVCDNSEEWMLQIMPRYGLDEQEMRSIVRSACKEPVKGSKIMKQIIEKLQGNTAAPQQQECGTGLTEKQIQNVMRQLPIGLKESLVGVPKNMQMPVLCAVLPIAAAYADGVEVKYCDGTLQHLGLMSIIHGEQASGKSVCKSAIDVWKRQFDREDAMARMIEDEWKERRKARKANEKAPSDPHVIIRNVPVTISCSTLLRRFKNADGHCIYSFCEELDTLLKTNGAGSWSSKYDIYRLSFDRGEWGQDYNSDQAESGVVRVAYNWTMLGTDGALRRCFRTTNVENGLSSRVLVAQMPDNSFAKMPKYQPRSEEEERQIQEAVTRLRSHSGLVDTPRLRRAIEKWAEQKRVEAEKDIDYVKDTYRKRAAVIAFRCGVVHHLLSLPPVVEIEGPVTLDPARMLPPSPTASVSSDAEGKESNATIQFALMMADYCLAEQISAFGDSLSESKRKERKNIKNQSAFDSLPPVFSMADLRALKRDVCSDTSLRKIISRWNIDGLVLKIDDGRWQKKPGV